ncbi:MAG: hypothetical protein HY645_05830 [Acidobacteria bacterium]|nr:hypothetical protein [Acidobacteriota bacterium]
MFRTLSLCKFLLFVFPTLWTAGCLNSDALSTTNPAPSRKAVAVSEIPENMTVQFDTSGRAFTATIRADAALPTPSGASILFPAQLFDSLTDNGVKSFFGAAGLYTESLIRGAPLLIQTSTQGFFNLPRAAQLSFAAGTLTVNPTGAALGEIPAGVYTMNFLPGVFNLISGAYNVTATLNFTGSNPLVLNKMLLINAQIIPHLGVGKSGSLSITSKLVVNNPGDPMAVTVNFFKQDGTALSVKAGNNTGSQHTLNMFARSSAELELDPAGVEPPQVGWALLTTTATHPFKSSVVFSNTNVLSSTVTAERFQVTGQNLRTEAGIEAPVVDTRHVLKVSKSADGLDTAIAVANPTAAAATITTIFREDGAATTSRNTLTLPARSQRAQFFTDLANLGSRPSLSGTLTLVSNTDIAVISLRTLNGEQSASLPSGTPGD